MSFIMIYSICSHKKIVHKSHCSVIRRIKKQNRRTFTGLSEAYDAGFCTCKICCPTIERIFERERKKIEPLIEKRNLIVSVRCGIIDISSLMGVWRIFRNPDSLKVQLYHKNIYKRNDANSYMPGFHLQKSPKGKSLYTLLNYICYHDTYMCRPAAPIAKTAGCGSQTPAKNNCGSNKMQESSKREEMKNPVENSRSENLAKPEPAETAVQPKTAVPEPAETGVPSKIAVPEPTVKKYSLPKPAEQKKPIVPNGKKVNIHGKSFCINVQVRTAPDLSPWLSGCRSDAVCGFTARNKRKKAWDLYDEAETDEPVIDSRDKRRN